MEPTTIAIDLAKRVFQIHFVDPDGTIHSKVLKRAQMLPFFANRPAGRVVMEACGSARHWARALARIGRDVRLIAAQFVRPFVKSNKNDAADAAAILEAAQRPGMRFVAVKTEDQQAMLALHRIRQQLVRIRVMQVNQLRGLLYEFGVVLPQGRRASIDAAKAALASLADELPAMLRTACRISFRDSVRSMSRLLGSSNAFSIGGAMTMHACASRRFRAWACSRQLPRFRSLDRKERFARGESLPPISVSCRGRTAREARSSSAGSTR